MIQNQSKSKDIKLGVLLSVFGALLLSTKGIFAKILYAEGADYVSVTMIRSVLSLPLFWFWFILKRNVDVRNVTRKAFWGAFFAGFLCYYIGAMVNFYALTLIDANLERLILYSFPAIVVVLSSLIQKKMPSLIVITSLIIIYCGLFLAIGGINKDLFLSNIFGVSLVMLSAISISIYFLFNEKYGNTIGSISFTTIAMTAATFGLVMHSLISNNYYWFNWSLNMWKTMFLLVTISTTIPLFMVAEGINKAGASISSIGTTVGPPSTILIAWLVLGETMTIDQIFGSLLILIGVILLQKKN